ncbi:MAG TPA: hypothetical protein PKL10_18055, partial [Nitrospira sp.]|nr:hypothetical protein [Nitrospira sp.]
YSFQSSPVTKDGRYTQGGGEMSQTIRFNPRPSLRTGATALTKTYDFQPGLPRLGANLMESFGIGDNGFVSPEKFSF